MDLYDRIVDQDLLVRRIYITVNHVVEEGSISRQESFEQMDLFTDYEALQKAEGAGKSRSWNGKDSFRRLSWILRRNSGKMSS